MNTPIPAQSTTQSFTNPIHRIDPAAIAREHGVAIFLTPLPLSFYGLLDSLEDGEPRIVVNRATTFAQRRETIAHLLGHFVFLSENEKATTDPKLRYIRSSDNTPCGNSREERYATNFAHELLMPLSEVAYLKEIDGSLVVLANAFGVSNHTMRSRLSDSL